MRTPDPWNIPRTPFSLSNVRPQGLSPGRIQTAMASGRIVRLRRGVYLAADAVPDEAAAMHVIRALAEQVVAPDLVASLETAALAHGLPLRSTDRAAAAPVRFARVAAAQRRSRRSTRHAIGLARLPEHHVVRLESGLLATSVARTAVDLAQRLPLPEALMLLDAALRAELAGSVGVIRADTYQDRRLVAAASRPLNEAAESVLGRRGRYLRAMLEVADVRRESALESLSAGHFMLAGLPRPEHQVAVPTPAGTYYPDNLWRAWRLIGEADGQGKYTDPARVTAEKLRDGHLRDEGYEILHWPGSEMFATPARVVDRVGRLLVARGWDGQLQPWTWC